ncbi:MAG: hypothetical protein IPM18_00015 [Phycisphaerales bacterium]|nr:hypothetical protein [Phycisphaerales bacterium]
MHLIERTEPSPDEQRARALKPSERGPRRPSGRLAFLVSHAAKDSEQPNWCDAENQRLEGLIGPITVELVAARRGTRASSERDRESRQYEKIRARRVFRSHLDSEEREWGKFVTNSVRDWQTAEQMRAYLAAFRAAVDSGRRTLRNKAEYDNFQAWVVFLANKADPLITTGLRPGEDVPPTNVPLAEMDISSRLRSPLESLGVRDANDTYQVSDDQLKQQGASWNVLRKEIERVLFGLGYAVDDDPSKPL